MTHAAPLAVGTLAILALATMLVLEGPEPGGLARAHAGLPELARLEGCAACHTQDGLTAGCLSCHVEIAGAAFHEDKQGDCASCHPEHHGEAFDITEAVAWEGSEGFDHSHVEFALRDAHDELACKACHKKTTYLGLAQNCRSCHTDVHEGNLFTDCLACHDQKAWKPAARFDHQEHFPLDGGHADAACAGCHDGTLTFHKVKGKTCVECHDDPHRAKWGETCDACHTGSAPLWTAAENALTAKRHGRTGFLLDRPHDEVACAGCHKQGYRVAEREQEDCAACHEDVHRGQFEAGCLDCHEKTHFEPHLFGRDRHETAFELREAHEKASCRSCHEEGRFAGTPQTCRECHEDVHKGQFGKRTCDACHDQTRFLPARVGVSTHGHFPLTGAHRAVACLACHEDGRFVGTPRNCRECHQDVHGGQFGEQRCTGCHLEDSSSFRILPYDHGARAGWALRGAHAAAACGSCHAGGRYRPTPAACAGCHTDVHRGQFNDARCDRCHTSFVAWNIERFDHDRRTRFKLDKTHRKADCSGCHPRVRQPDGTAVVQFKPIGTECRSCHDPRSR